MKSFRQKIIQTLSCSKIYELIRLKFESNCKKEQENIEKKNLKNMILLTLTF